MAQVTRVLRPRECPSCHDLHPPLRTCATGGNPWDGTPVRVVYTLRPPDAHRYVRWEWTFPPDDLAEAERRGDLVAARSDYVETVPQENRTPEAKLKRFRDGAASETALARMLGLRLWYPEDHGLDMRADLLGIVEVRHTDYLDGSLLARHRDRSRSERPFVLITGRRDRTLRARGWLYGWEVMADDYRDAADYWSAPGEETHGMDSLLEVPGLREALEAERARERGA